MAAVKAAPLIDPTALVRRFEAAGRAAGFRIERFRKLRSAADRADQTHARSASSHLSFPGIHAGDLAEAIYRRAHHKTLGDTRATPSALPLAQRVSAHRAALERQASRPARFVVIVLVRRDACRYVVARYEFG